jgi:1-hydroxycarotenoid 3,4-desaturase
VSSTRVVVVGAGIGGLSAALSLAAAGCEVTVVERAATPGGKARHVHVGGRAVDGGPTVFTMRWVFEQLLGGAGFEPQAELPLTELGLLARHAWDEGGRLDLFTDTERSAEAISDLSGAAEADRFRAFCRRSARVYESLERRFMAAPRPSLPGLIWRSGLAGLPGLLATSPFVNLWKALGEHFHDHRLQQLFGRYATYCGSSPWLSPSTLMLIAHAEKLGVWSVAGGMHGLAQVLERCATARGARFVYGHAVERIEKRNGRASAVALDDGRVIEADAIIWNGDTQPIADGRLGDAIRGAVPARARVQRSLSALTWCMAARAEGFPLTRHTVFFSDDYAAEFEDILVRRRLPRGPTVYVCAQDRGDDGSAPAGEEGLLVLVNAPADGDLGPPDAASLEACTEATFGMLARCGLRLSSDPASTVLTTPAGFEALFPGSGGGLYGSASHGWQSSFTRPGSRSRVPGLYLAGGGVHPGAGVPMVSLSGQLAAQALLQDRAARRI